MVVGGGRIGSFPAKDPVQVQGGEEAAGGRFRVPLHPSDLAGEEEIVALREGAPRGQPGREIQIAVPMDGSPPEKLRLLQPGNHAKDLSLLTHPQSGLEPHQIPHLPLPVLSSELNHGKGPAPRPGVLQSDGLHGAEPKGIIAPGGHHLHGKTPFEKWRRSRSPRPGGRPQPAGLPGRPGILPCPWGSSDSRSPHRTARPRTPRLRSGSPGGRWARWRRRRKVRRPPGRLGWPRRGRRT